MVGCYVDNGVTVSHNFKVVSGLLLATTYMQQFDCALKILSCQRKR